MGLEKVHALRKRHLQYIQNENTLSLSILEQSDTLPSSSPTHCTLNTFGAVCGNKESLIVIDYSLYFITVHESRAS